MAETGLLANWQTGGNNVHLTTNSFSLPYYVDAKGKRKGFRKTENLDGSRTLTADLDVKEGAYPTRRAARDDLARVIKATGLPEPTLIVNSGGGIHVWWVLDRSLPADEWRALAKRFVALLKHHDLMFDQQCTANPTGVLRLPGTANFKLAYPRAVTIDYVDRPSCCCSADDIIRVIDASDVTAGSEAVTAGIPPAPGKPQSSSSRTSNFTAGVDDSAPPVDLDAVADECPMLADTLATGGLGYSEPQWRQVLLLAHFSTDPLGNAVRLSDGDPRYTLDGVAEKLKTMADQQSATNFGWPACTSFAEFSPHCKTCPHRDEGRSPLHFGLVRQGFRQAGQELPAPPDPGATDWLSRSLRQHGVIEAGRYHGRILTRDIRSFNTAKTSGVSFVIGITDGRFENYTCPISMACDGSYERVIGRDLAILSNWANALGIGPTSDPVELVKALGRAGEHRSILFDIGVEQWGGARTLFLKKVDLEDKPNG